MRRAALAYVIVFISLAAYVPYLSLYYQSLGIPLGLIGALMAFTSTTALVSAPAWGAIHDRFPRSPLLLPLAGCVAALGGFGLWQVGASPLLPVFAGMFSAGMAGTTPMMDVRVLELSGSDRTRYGLVRAFGSASFMVCAPLVGLVNDANGYRGLFLVLIPALLAGGLAASAVPGRSNVHRAPSMLRAPGRVLGHRPIAMFLLGSLVCWTAVYSQAGFFSIYLKSLGAPADQVGWAWSFGALLEIPTMLLFPVLARRFGIERLIVSGAAITLTREIANLTFTLPAVLLACSLLQGLGYALLVVGGITFVSTRAPKGTAATAQGLLSATTVSLAAIIGSGVGGQLAGLLTIRGLYVISVALGVLGLVMIAAAVLPAAVLPAAPPGSIPLPVDPVVDRADHNLNAEAVEVEAVVGVLRGNHSSRRRERGVDVDHDDGVDVAQVHDGGVERVDLPQH
ncbi:MAG: MFS transporter [Candidatus Limnocylindrales bacterium]